MFPQIISPPFFEFLYILYVPFYKFYSKTFYKYYEALNSAILEREIV
jgi:hypothetical protein